MVAKRATSDEIEKRPIKGNDWDDRGDDKAVQG
jgi:hypothetical protein